MQKGEALHTKGALSCKRPSAWCGLAPGCKITASKIPYLPFANGTCILQTFKGARDLLPSRSKLSQVYDSSHGRSLSKSQHRSLIEEEAVATYGTSVFLRRYRLRPHNYDAAEYRRASLTPVDVKGKYLYRMMIIMDILIDFMMKHSEQYKKVTVLSLMAAWCVLFLARLL